MSLKIELYYHAPENVEREKILGEQIASLGGKWDCRETTGPTNEAICLTYEFADRKTAEKAADMLRSKGEHVEGPCDY